MLSAIDCGITKGQEILVEGALRQENWEDKETGKNRSKLFVKADRWQFTQYKAAELARQAQQTQAQGVER
jgi:single-stranded DNA-binding protein